MEEIVAQTTADRLRIARDAHGWSQLEAGRKFGYKTGSTIQNWEAGGTPTGMHTWAKISRVYADPETGAPLSLHWLVTGEGPQYVWGGDALAHLHAEASAYRAIMERVDQVRVGPEPPSDAEVRAADLGSSVHGAQSEGGGRSAGGNGGGG